MSSTFEDMIPYMLHEIEMLEFDIDKFKARISSFFSRQDEKLGKQAIKNTWISYLILQITIIF